MIGALLINSCGETSETIDTSLINGKWFIVNAKRNTKYTSTLNEAYFVFDKNKTMQTNFMGEEMNAKYTVVGNVITQESEDKLSYDILTLSKDTMILKTMIMDHYFEFYMLNERIDPFGKAEEEIENIGIKVDELESDS